MNKKIIAFGASSSKNSINKKLASFAAQQIEDVEVQILDLNDYEMPIYSIDKEKANGIHELAVSFKEQLVSADGIVISFAEHNGAYSAAFKNIMDWVSRLEGSVWDNKPMFLMATSPGGRGGKTVLDIATNSFKHMNRNSIHSFSLPSFNQNFSETKGIVNTDLLESFNNVLRGFSESIR